eukprot:360633-Chlamydomonas_euryale.AAC.20
MRRAMIFHGERQLLVRHGRTVLEEPAHWRADLRGAATLRTHAPGAEAIGFDRSDGGLGRGSSVVHRRRFRRRRCVRVEKASQRTSNA